MERRLNGGFFALLAWGAYIWRGLYMEGLIFGILRYFFPDGIGWDDCATAVFSVYLLKE